MTKLSKLASTLPFAHLLGVKAAESVENPGDPNATASAAKAESDDDERKKRDGESDEDYAKRMDELDAKGKAKGEKEKDDSDEDDEDEKSKAAVARNNARCKAIVAEGFAMGAPRQACILAFDTRLSVEAAIETMKASAADRKSGAPSLADRMAASSTRLAGPDAPAAPEPGTAAEAAKLTVQAILAAGRKARGEA